MVGHHHAVRMARRADPLQMGHLRRPGEAHPPPRLVGAPAEVRVLQIHEVGLVETPQLLERTPAGQEARAGHPARSRDHVSLRGSGVVAKRERILRIEQRKQRVSGSVGEGGKVADRRIDLSLLREDARAHQCPRRLGLERVAQCGQRTWMHDQVRIADENELGWVLLPRQCSQTTVDPGAESDVAPRSHQPDGLRWCVRLQVPECNRGAPGRAVLHHDDRRDSILEEGADAAFEQRPGVVVDHDGADRAGHPVLSTPW